MGNGCLGCGVTPCRCFESNTGPAKVTVRSNWVGLSRSEAANLWADAHDIDGKMIWTPAQLFQEIERRLRERNT